MPELDRAEIIDLQYQNAHRRKATENVDGRDAFGALQRGKRDPGGPASSSSVAEGWNTSADMFA